MPALSPYTAQTIFRTADDLALVRELEMRRQRAVAARHETRRVFRARLRVWVHVPARIERHAPHAGGTHVVHG